MTHDPGVVLTTEGLAELRHELRTPVNHIMGYTEMLLEDVPAGDARHAALETTLAAAREMLVLISRSLADTGSSIGSRELEALYEALHGPHERIVRALEPMLRSGDTANAEFMGDIQRILTAADRLRATPQLRPSLVSEAPSAEDIQAAASPGSPALPRVLVVDDDEQNREVLMRRLQREGYQTVPAESGQRALDLMDQGGFDLVLLDVLMPGIDGYEVLTRLKDRETTRDVPVIMVSALDDMSSVVRCIERGAEDYLPKPFDPVLLRARINASLEKKRLRDKEREYLREVDRVIEAATAVETGNYRPGTLANVAERTDALGKLARVFDNMAGEIKVREERLRERVRELRGEIDFARRASAEIVIPRDAGTFDPGQRFGSRYEIVRLVGGGGMGTVYRARDLELSEDVAIKVLRPEFLSDKSLIERFKSEIRLARRISHRNVVRTHDFGEFTGIFYLTMEHVEGITVRELIDTRGTLHPQSALAIATQLAEALAVAHEEGVIHRDVKPQNMLLDPEGVLKVMDFGVARLAERSSQITEAGLLVGTPAYMAPEQLMGEEIDTRCDLYAVGVVLYECLTGEIPFDGSTPVSLIAKVLSEEPRPPATLNTDIPAPLSALILKLLAKRPEDRVQTARELAERLAALV